MNLNFSMLEPECIAFTEEYLRHSPVHQRTRLRIRWMVPVILSVVMAMSFARSGPTILASAFFPISIVGWLIFYPYRFDARVRAHTLAQMEESSYSKTFGDYQVEIRNDAIVSRGPTGLSEHTWASVDRIHLTPEYLFVFFVGLTGLPISISQIGSEQAKAAFDLMELHRANAD